jgi:curli biogenesis system outer membrane secretion channel CsgG
MSNRSVKFVAALFASILAGANLTSVTDIRAQAAAAADNCLTAPKDKTPAGSHWYYRL